MRFPAPVHVTTCLPCGWRQPVRSGHAYAPRCDNCGSSLEHYDTTINNRAEWRDVYRAGSRGTRVERPRLVIGAVK